MITIFCNRLIFTVHPDNYQDAHDAIAAFGHLITGDTTWADLANEIDNAYQSDRAQAVSAQLRTF